MAAHCGEVSEQNGWIDKAHKTGARAGAAVSYRVQSLSRRWCGFGRKNLPYKLKKITAEDSLKMSEFLSELVGNYPTNNCRSLLRRLSMTFGLSLQGFKSETESYKKTET